MLLHYVICLLFIETVYTCDLFSGNKKRPPSLTGGSGTKYLHDTPQVPSPPGGDGMKIPGGSGTKDLHVTPQVPSPPGGDGMKIPGGSGTKYLHVTPQVPSPPGGNGMKIPVPPSGTLSYTVTHYQDEQSAKYCHGIFRFEEMGYVTLVDTVNYDESKNVVLDAFCVLPRAGPIKIADFQVFCYCELGHAFLKYSGGECLVAEYRIENADPSIGDQAPQVQRKRTLCETTTDRKALCKEICPDGLFVGK